MSNQLFGNSNLSTITVLQVQGTLQKVSIDIPSFLNRKTKKNTIRQNFKNAGGFIPALCQPVLVAELPNGEQYLFDGDHRRWMQKLASAGQQTHMDAYVIPVPDYATISKYFVLVNKTCRKNISAEEFFVHEVASRDPDAVALSKNLATCKLTVSLQTGEPNDSVGAANGFLPNTKVLVNINGFREALVNRLHNVELASEIIQKNWKSVNRMPTELLSGFARTFRDFPGLLDKRNRKINPLWNAWIALQTQNTPSTDSFIRVMKMLGGNVHNKEELCIAKGILTSFRNWCTDTKSITETAFLQKNFTDIITKLDLEIAPKEDTKKK